MHMRVDAARHDIAARRVENRVSRKLRPDLDDHTALDLDVCLVGEIGGDDGSALDDCAHVVSPHVVLVLVIILASGAPLIRRYAPPSPRWGEEVTPSPCAPFVEI